jgi:5-methylcytosine-specific restriction endonuclease McrA
VERWINEARTFIVDTIKKLIEDLIALAKALVQAIVDLANRIRKLITDLIRAAIDFVNRLAAQLKHIIKTLLDALAKLLGDLLRILLKALMDFIRATIEAIKQVMALASQLLGMLGTFLFIAIDFLDDPGGWLSGAKNSAVDGAKNHLFREVKNAVKAWFQQKIEEIIGVGKAVIDVLIKGGFTLEKIVKETWDAIVPMLPFIIGEIVITKVVAKLIPGAGWVMAVIDAIKVAIGALGAILRAIGAVLAWLISVRKGGAGLLFAKAVAAGIVALLELAYQYLLDGIGKYVSKVGKRLKGVAARILKGKKRGPGAPPRDAGGPDTGSGRPAEPGTRRPEDRIPLAAPRPPSSGRPGGMPTPRPPAVPRPSAGPRPSTRPPAGSRSTGAPGRPPGRSDAPPVTTRPGTAPATPRPGTAPATTRPGTAPAGTPASGPTPTPATAPAKPPPATSKNPDGSPKSIDGDRPNTRPTPPAAPKPMPRPKLRSDPDAPRSKPDTDAADAKPGRDDSPATDRDSGQDRDRDGGGDRDRDGDRPHRDGDAPGKPPRKDHDDPRQRDKDNKRDNEESDAAKKKRLEMIIAEIRGILRTATKDGMLDSRVRQLMTVLRRHFRLRALYGVGAPTIHVKAILNPTEDVTDLKQKKDPDNGARIDYADDHPDDPPEVKVNDKLRVRSHREGWLASVVTKVDPEQEKFTVDGHGKKGYEPDRTVRFNDKGDWEDYRARAKGAKEKGTTRVARYLFGKEFEAIRHNAEWAVYDHARQTMNYRKRYDFTNPSSPQTATQDEGSVGPQWHHIVEQRQGGKNSLENLVLVRHTANNEFKEWMNAAQPESDPKRTVTDLPSTGQDPVHVFLNQAGDEERREWGYRCLEEVFGERGIEIIDYEEDGRGKWHELLGHPVEWRHG